jgi:N-acetylmuramoyl-L-alanine amidase
MKRLRIGLMVLLLLITSLPHRPAWAASTLIRLVGYDQASQRIVVFADGPLAPRTFALAHPHRWVVDFPNSRYRGATVSLPAIPGTPISRVRVSQWNMGTVRMVFDLDARASFPHDLLKISEQNYRLAFLLSAPVAAARPAAPKPAPAEQARGAQGGTGLVTGLAVEGDRLVLRTSRRVTAVRTTRAEQGQTFFDFDAMKLSPKLKARVIKAPKLGIREARLLPHGNSVRLVIEAPGSKQEWREESQTDRWMLARQAPPKPKPPVFAAVPVEDGESGLTLKRVGRGWQLTLTAHGKVGYRLVGPSRHDRLTFDITEGTVDLPRDSLYVDNGLIARVRTLPQGPGTLRVIVELDQEVGFAVRTTASQRSVVIAMAPPGAPIPAGPPVAEATPPPKQAEATPAPAPVIAPPPLPRAVDAALDRKDERKRVTLDPGHGGEDPGGMGAHGTEEKDVTLSLALKLQKLMRDSGMEVQMTRTDDMQIQLRPRVAIGDDFNSDVFISIHTNAISNPTINGIETYYFTPQSLPLARAVHRHLVAKLGRPDRGIRRNNFVVVKYNKMPACLVEIGYLTNPTEERLLKSAEYQQRAAEAILAGVQDYFKTRDYRQ